jgi:flagella basal body P-ring formation protein FlgA
MLLALTMFLSITIALPDKAHVRGNEIKLGEIATIQGADAADAERLAQLQLGGAPAPGYMRVFRKADIETRVRSVLPRAEIVFTGAETCRVEPELQTVRGDELRAAADEALRALLTARDASFVAQGQLADLQVPRPAAKLELRASPDVHALRSGTVSIPIQVWIDGQIYQTAFAGYSIDLFETRPVLARDVRRGDVLGADAVVLQRVRIVDVLDERVLGPTMVVGASALRDLARGAAVTDHDVQRAQLVKRGELVTIEIRKGAICARSSAVAEQDGAIGDVIHVTTAETKRALTAVVVGRAAVQIDLANVQKSRESQ